MRDFTSTAKASILILCAGLSACGATIGLKATPSTTGAQLAVSDQRQKAEKTYFRSSITSPVQFFGDEDFSPSPLAHVGELAKGRLASGGHALEVSQLRVIDIFPQRLSAATSAALTGAFGSMGYALYFAESSVPIQDNISCLITGRIDGKPLAKRFSVPYRISPFAGLIKNDPAFQAAVHGCLDQLSTYVAQTAAQ